MPERTAAGCPPAARRLLLDTDIGTDVDDALALAVILGSPELDLIAAITAYGDVRLRARIAKRIARLAGAEMVAVPGESATLAHREIWWAGHEGRNYPDLELETVDDHLAAGTLIARSINEAPAKTHILAIAPLTNIANAFTTDPSLAGKLGQLWIMGGDWTRRNPAEHNFRSDPEAAKVVFESGCPTTVIGLEVTSTVDLDQTQLATLATAGPLGRLLALETHQWLARWGDDVDHPHDAVAALALLDEELFTFSPPGVVTVNMGSDPGQVSFIPDPVGTVRVARSVDPVRAIGQILARIQTACRVDDRTPAAVIQQ